MRPVIFVDTDVTLDLLLCRHPFVKDAKRLFVLVETGKVEACSTPIILANIFYLLRKQHPAESVKLILKDLRLLLTILPVDANTVDQALASPFSDFEDALQYHAVLPKGVSAIITRNTRDFRNAFIPVMTAGEFLTSRD